MSTPYPCRPPSRQPRPAVPPAGLLLARKISRFRAKVTIAVPVLGNQGGAGVFPAPDRMRGDVMDDLTDVGCFPTEVEAEVVAGLLETSGIDTVITHTI